jgi:hypothetical protein
MKIFATNLAIIGPSGAGKSPLGSFINSDLVVEPHRVREKPRDESTGSPDIYYMSRMAYNGLLSVLDECEKLVDPGAAEQPELQVYKHVLIFKVRGDPQVLFLPERLSESMKRKVEIYGPVLAKLLKYNFPQSLFQGHNFVLLLNPWNQPIEEVDPTNVTSSDYSEGKVVADMLEKRGESQKEILKRLSRIPEELYAWKAIAELSRTSERLHFLDVQGWEHAECTYSPDAKARAVLAAKTIMEIAETKLPKEYKKLFLSFFPDI